MPGPTDPNNLVTLKALVTSNQLGASELVEWLTLKGILTKQDIADMIEELQQNQAPALHDGMKPRSVPRYKLQCRIFFAAGETEGEGTVTNLSKAGCKIECETTPEPGTELEMSFFAPDHPWPLKIERAVVRWLKGEEFGLEFLIIQPAQRDRLRAFLMNLK